MFTATYFGEAAILLHFKKLILIDPGIIDEKPLVTRNIVHPSYVLVSHSHRENLGNAASFAIGGGSLILSNAQVIDELRGQGAQGFALEPLPDNKTFDTRVQVTITAHELSHGGMLAPRNTAFMIKSAEGKILHLGHAKEYAALSGRRPDLLCVPVAGKRRGTLDPQGAAEATASIRPRYVLPTSGDARQVEEFLTQVAQRAASTVTVTPKTGEPFTIG
jgi:L-ascorbate metabolism protein UlaG (beta-lactamase superfamily)